VTDPALFPKQTDTLKLRAKTRPVTRINRKVLLAGTGIGILALFAVAAIALDPPRAADERVPGELYNTVTKRAPDGLAGLPASYDTWRPSPDVPLLGTPQTGDLGGTIVAEEDRWGLAREWDVMPGDDFRPSQEDEAARARRLTDAKLADQAGKSGVFFEISGKAGSNDTSALTALPEASGPERLSFSARNGVLENAPAVADPNLQSRKIAFAEKGPDRAIYNPYSLEIPVSPFQVMAGTLIPASLVTAVNSDLPGAVIAQVTQPVYDTVTGAHLLIPQGTRLLGRYQSEVSAGQDRTLILWERMIFPDGRSLRIAEPATDASGAGGVADRTDNHWRRVFTAAGLATILGVGAELGSESEDDIARAIRRGTADTINQAGQRVVERNLGIQPTIRIRPGWPVRVLVTRDLILAPYEGDIQ